MRERGLANEIKKENKDNHLDNENSSRQRNTFFNQLNNKKEPENQKLSDEEKKANSFIDCSMNSEDSAVKDESARIIQSHIKKINRRNLARNYCIKQPSDSIDYLVDMAKIENNLDNPTIVFLTDSQQKTENSFQDIKEIHRVDDNFYDHFNQWINGDKSDVQWLSLLLKNYLFNGNKTSDPNTWIIEPSNSAGASTQAIFNIKHPNDKLPQLIVKLTKNGVTEAFELLQTSIALEYTANQKEMPQIIFPLKSFLFQNEESILIMSKAKGEQLGGALFYDYFFTENLADHRKNKPKFLKAVYQQGMASAAFQRHYLVNQVSMTEPMVTLHHPDSNLGNIFYDQTTNQISWIDFGSRVLISEINAWNKYRMGEQLSESELQMFQNIKIDGLLIQNDDMPPYPIYEYGEMLETLYMGFLGIEDEKKGFKGSDIWTTEEREILVQRLLEQVMRDDPEHAYILEKIANRDLQKTVSRPF